MTDAKQQCARQQSKLVDAQASHTSLTQALEQQLATKQSEHQAALQLLEDAKQSVAQLEAARQQQSDRVSELQSQLEASQDISASAKAQLASQAARTAGMVPLLRVYVSMCCESNRMPHGQLQLYYLATQTCQAS